MLLDETSIDQRKAQLSVILGLLINVEKQLKVILLRSLIAYRLYTRTRAH